MPLISGILNWKAQQEANEMNYRINQENNAFNASEAEKARMFNSAEAVKQRDWEKMMSDTAVSRGVADIKNAGLNPYLAITGGSGALSASSPSGAAAYGSSASAVNSHMAPATLGEISSGLRDLASSAMSVYTIKKVAGAVKAGNVAAALKTAGNARILKSVLKLFL